MEAMAVKKGLEAYLESKKSPQSRILIESDSIEVVKALNHKEEDLSESRVILEEISQLASLAGEVSFTKCPRRVNGIAHTLARSAAGIWSESMSSSVVEDGGFGQFFSSTLEDK